MNKENAFRNISRRKKENQKKNNNNYNNNRKLPDAPAIKYNSHEHIKGGFFCYIVIINLSLSVNYNKLYKNYRKATFIHIYGKIIVLRNYEVCMSRSHYKNVSKI